MSQRVPPSSPPTGSAFVTLAAVACISCWTGTASAQSAQRLAVTGTVGPRCWVSQATLGNPSPAERVQCSGQRAQMLISADNARFQLCAIHRQAADDSCDWVTAEAHRLTLTPRI